MVATNQRQVAWCTGNGCDITSTASPEVMGAVDLLSLRQATWGPRSASPKRSKVTPLRGLPPAACNVQKPDSAAPSIDPVSFGFNTPGIDPETPTRSEAARGDCRTVHIDSDSTPNRVCRTLRLQPAVLHRKSMPHSAAARRSPALHATRSPRLQPAIAKPIHKGTGRSKDPTSIKEWAALTTWLRMNLHQARTAKRQVCFVGQQDSRWMFSLNPRLSWEEVSKETKQRLRLLPKEAELAFTHKYPHRDPEAWKEKLVKYRPDLSGEGYDIALGPLVYDLHKVYLTHEVHSRRSLL